MKPSQLAPVIAAAFGPGRRLNDLTRIEDGNKKGVYRLRLDNGLSAILYYWDPADNYWPVEPDDPDGDPHADPFSPASGLELFQASHQQLQALGVRTPHVYLLDDTRSRLPHDLALVEDVPGGNLEDLLERDPSAAARVLPRLAPALTTMWQHRGHRFGKLAWVEGVGEPPADSCEQVVLARAYRDLAQAARQLPALAEAEPQIAGALARLASAVRPRQQYALIHGELDPGHVLLDQHGDPVLIDIEGAMFFDLEWEHVFLELRFGEDYRWLRVSGLDDDRLRLYRLALHLSLVAGPLQALARGHPDHHGHLRWIIDYNLAQARTLAAEAH